MTLQQLRYVMAVAETGSMNKAAEYLYISQPTLTNTIRSLEEDAGITIFRRTNKGVQLTTEGSDFLFYAKKVCDQYDQLRWRYSGKGRKIKVLSVSTQHYAFVCEAFSAIINSYDTSMYNFSILETKTQQVIDDVTNGKSEIGVLFLSEFNRKGIENTLHENRLTFRKIVRCHIYVYVGDSHPLADKEMIDFDEIIRYPLLTYDQGENSPLFMAEEVLGEQDYPYVIKVSDRASMLQIMDKVNGFTFCSGAVRGAVGKEKFRVLPLKKSAKLPYDSMEIGYIFRDELSSLGKQFVEELYKAAPMDEDDEDPSLSSAGFIA